MKREVEMFKLLLPIHQTSKAECWTGVHLDILKKKKEKQVPFVVDRCLQKKNLSNEKIKGIAKRFVFTYVQEPLNCNKNNKCTILKIFVSLDYLPPLSALDPSPPTPTNYFSFTKIFISLFLILTSGVDSILNKAGALCSGQGM